MHAVLITFTSAVDLEALTTPFADYATELTGVHGLVAKTWLVDGDILGGFHLFETDADADAYLAGPLLASVRANPIFGNFAITHFDVVEPLSTVTNGLGGKAAQPIT